MIIEEISRTVTRATKGVFRMYIEDDYNVPLLCITSGAGNHNIMNMAMCCKDCAMITMDWCSEYCNNTLTKYSIVTIQD